MSMVKLIYSGSFNTYADVSMRIVEDPVVLTKSASTIFGCDYNKLMPDKNHVGIHLTAVGAFEKYGCFFAGAPVQTIHGVKPIETVGVGDLVLTHTGAYRPVTATYCDNYDGDCIALNICCLPAPINCTANHPFLVVSRRGLTPKDRFNLRQDDSLQAVIDGRVESASWVSADSIKPGDYVVVPLATGTNDFGTIPAEYDPYVLGFYVAEGCLSKEYRELSTKGEYKEIIFTGSVKDTLTWDYIDSWLCSIGRSPVARGESYTSTLGVRVTVGFKELAGKIAEWFGNNAMTKYIHPIVWGWDKASRIKFLAGYFDGDGCITWSPGSRYHGTLRTNTASLSLALDFQRLLASVGIPSSINQSCNKVSSGCFGLADYPIWELSVGAYYSNIILEHTLRLPKHERVFKQCGAAAMQLGNNYALLKVLSTACTNIITTKYNLEVAEDHSYVVLNTAVKNSNRNGDGFPKKACVDYHDTFVKNGALFRHHKNKDRDKNLGIIKMSAYNHDMERIELFVHANKDKAADELTRLEKEGEIPFSMACSVAYDRCNICGAMRKNASDPNQCDHIKYDLGKVFDDGKVACTHNDEPKFFDISFVGRPADRIAWQLKIAAGETLSSVKLAEAAGVWVPDYMEITSAEGMNKLRQLRKIAEFQRCYTSWLPRPHSVKSSTDKYFYELHKAASADLSNTNIDMLRQLDPKEAMAKLAKAGVLLTPEQFFKYAAGPNYTHIEPHLHAITAILPGIINTAVKQADCKAICNSTTFDVSPRDAIANDTFIEKLASCSIIGDNRDSRIIENTFFNKNIKTAVDKNVKLCVNTHELGELARKYAAYQLSAVNAIIGLHDDTDEDSVCAIAAAQNILA